MSGKVKADGGSVLANLKLSDIRKSEVALREVNTESLETTPLAERTAPSRCNKQINISKPAG